MSTDHSPASARPDPAEHVKLAFWAAHRWGRGAPDEEGVLEVAFLALLRASETFDPDRGAWGPHAVATVSRATRGERARQFREAARTVPLMLVDEEGEEFERPDAPRAEALNAPRLMLLREVRRRLEDLPPRERRVLELRYLSEGDEEITLEEVGRALGVGKARAGQLEARALARLRRRLGARPAEGRRTAAT